MLLGLTSSFFFSLGNFATDIYASILFFFVYLLDHCDGEVARAKNQTSRFGQMFDSFVDWIFHSAFFIGLGWGKYSASTDFFWVWLGIAAALGATINYFIGCYLLIKRQQDASPPSEYHYASPDKPITWMDQAIFVFRELARADFWLLVFTLSLFGLAWVRITGFKEG